MCLMPDFLRPHRPHHKLDPIRWAGGLGWLARVAQSIAHVHLISGSYPMTTPKNQPGRSIAGDFRPPPRPAVISRGTPWSPGSRFRVAPSHPPPLPCHCSSPFIRSPIYFSSFPLFLSPSSFSPHPFSSILLTRAERERERGVFVAWRLRRSSSTTGGQGRAVVTRSRSRSQTGLSAFLVVVAATAAITAARMVILRGVATRWLAMAGTSPTTALPQQYLSSSSSSSSLSSSFVCCCYVST